MSEVTSPRVLYDKYFRLAWLLLIFPVYKVIEGIVKNNSQNIIIYAISSATLIVILTVTSIIYSRAMKKRLEIQSSK